MCELIPVLMMRRKFCCVTVWVALLSMTWGAKEKMLRRGIKTHLERKTFPLVLDVWDKGQLFGCPWKSKPRGICPTTRRSQWYTNQSSGCSWYALLNVLGDAVTVNVEAHFQRNKTTRCSGNVHLGKSNICFCSRYIFLDFFSRFTTLSSSVKLDKASWLRHATICMLCNVLCVNSSTAERTERPKWWSAGKVWREQVTASG